MRRIAAIVALALVGSSSSRGQCTDYLQAVLESFLPQKPDVNWLRTQLQSRPEVFTENLIHHEERLLSQKLIRVHPYHPALDKLREALRQFYEAAADIYGVKLSPGKLVVARDDTVNAFATGHYVVVNEGLLDYLSDPISYVQRKAPYSLGSRYGQPLLPRYPWVNDFENVYAALAHEAAHNVMRHVAARFLEGVGRQLDELEANARGQRQAVANGKRGPGVKHYFARAFLRFASHFQTSQSMVTQEEEADAVGALLLARTGYDPRTMVLALERIHALHAGDNRTGWSAILSSLLCSTHPRPQERLAAVERNVSCLDWKKDLCEDHAPFPVEQRLEELRGRLRAIDEYVEETQATLEGGATPTCDQPQVTEIQPNPRDAEMYVDGRLVPPGRMRLPCGRHVLTAFKQAYRPVRIVFGVFPDVKSTLKFKLEKCKPSEPCDAILDEVEPGTGER